MAAPIEVDEEIETVDAVCMVCHRGDGLKVLICDTPDCDGKTCFACAQVLEAPEGDWFCGRCVNSGLRWEVDPASRTTGARPTRKLRPQGSHPEAPDKKALMSGLAQARASPVPGGSDASEFQQAGASTDSRDPITSKLDLILSKMATKEDLSTLKEAITQETTSKIANAVGPLQHEVASFRGEVEGISVRVAKLEEILRTTDSSRVETLVKDVEEKLESLRLKSSIHDPQQHLTAVVGGLQSMGDFESASRWVSGKLWRSYGPSPIDVYKKGDFSGMVFAKFLSQTDRDTAISLLHNTNDGTWAKPDMPLEERIVRKIILGAKYIMSTKWGWAKSDLWADLDKGTLALGGEVMFTVNFVRGAEPSLIYAPGWQEYLWDMAHPEFRELVENAVGQARKGIGKGTSKKGKTPQ